METLSWLVIIGAAWFAAVAFWMMKELVDHHFWEERGKVIERHRREAHAHNLEMAQAAMRVNGEMARAVRPPTLPGDEWKSGSEAEPEGGD